MLFNLPSKGRIESIFIDGTTTATKYPSFIDVVYTLPYAIWWFVGMEVPMIICSF
jgi:hypothetical protein